ncbi:U2 snRNP complex subunit YSF3 Ecym_6377 [Eremothecium cymbalariae DBVPG|uniref:Splicing factor subunit n=1 Tax=Eremothecium cymbalariae (strain CBS 270.75 / DBVPG 7215 / KCTC 17166 / NRRL Y-17582) TaxID=931890 RepID=G8JUH2_ERECY|nr:hypothetical protein Ecym_6377 [Eremothecium cymbalariae DBVPG\
MSDKIRQEQLFHIMKQKHIGLGTDDTTKDEFFTQIHRDTYSSIVNHSALLEYTMISSPHDTKAETKLQMIEKMCVDYTNEHY